MMSIIRIVGVCGVAIGGLVASACHNVTVERVDPETVVDLDYRFNDSDARAVYKAMVDDALYRNWITRWMETSGGQRPVVIVGPISNNTQDYINTTDFSTEWERELLNSDRVRFVAMKDQRDAVREERTQGLEWNTPETQKQLRAELGADLMLIGRITDTRDRSYNNRTVLQTYKVTLELINMESNEKVWIGSHDIKKVARRS